MNLIGENRKKRNRQRGQSIVEISLITPLLMVALYVPADFGIALFVGNLTQVAVREGARVGSGLQKSGDVPDLLFSSAEAATVKTEVFSRLPSYLGSPTVTVKFYTGTACMEFLEVTAQGQYNYALYRLMRIFGGSVPDSTTISRTTQMRYKYQPYNNDASCTDTSTTTFTYTS